MFTASKGSRGCPAFTLIELLVVVSVISLLIAILLPSLSKAREQAKSSVCLSNLRRMGIQLTMYVHDYGKHPPVRLKKAPNGAGVMEDYYLDFGGRYPRKAPRWQWFLSQRLGPVIDPNDYAGENEFNQSMAIDNKFFEDPSLKGYSQDVRNGAYGYNGAYLGNSRETSAGWVRFPVSDASIRAASGTAAFADSRGGAEPHGNHSYWLDPPKRAKYGLASNPEQGFGPNPAEPGETLGHSPVEARHGGRGNVSFCDGHAQTMTLGSLGYQVFPGTNRVVTVDMIDRTRANNRLWSGTGEDDVPGEFSGRSSSGD